MDRSSTTIDILESEKWRQLLESTAASLQINLHLFTAGTQERFSVYSKCPFCGMTLPPLETNESNNDGVAADGDQQVQESFRLDGKHLVTVRSFTCCGAGSALDFGEKVHMIRQLLTAVYDILPERSDERQLAAVLMPLRRVSHIVLIMFGDHDKALERVVVLMLSAAVILFDAGGSWFEYTADGQHHMLTKGSLNPAFESSSLNICSTVAVEIQNPVVDGTLGIISPVDPDRASSFLDYMVNECIIIFEIDKLLKQMESKLSVLLNAVDNLVLMADRRKYICFANKAAAHLLNRPVYELIGLPVSDIEAPWRQCILSESEKVTKGIKDLLMNGSDESYVDWEAYPLAESRDMPGWLIMARDRTDYYRLQELVERTENLVHASALLGSIAHEIRNPMATFKGLLQIIELKSGTPEISRYVGIGMNEIKKITLLLDVFSQTGKAAEAALEKIDTKAFMEEVYSLAVTGFNGPDIEITAAFAAVAPLMADRRQLTQAIFNLIKNAYEALNRSGKIALFLSQRDGDWIEIRICDNGPGISDHIKDKLFKPYFSTKADGTGLGLAIVRSIINSHNGTISVFNLPEGGACFSILLPTCRI